MEEVADIGGDLIGVVSRGHVDVLRRTDGEHVTGLAAPPIRNLQPGRSGTFFAEVGSTVQEWRLERGRVWQLDAAMAAAPGYATVIGDDPPREEAVIVVPLGEGTTLAGFRTSTAPDDGWELPNSCDGLHPSWDLGDLDAWAGAGVVAALLDDRDGPQQLWVGLPGADTSAKVILTARPLDGSGTAVFSAFDDVWTDVLYVLGGGRTAANFPPHWVVAARFSETGCWELRVTVDGTHRTVVIPVTTPDPSAAAPRAYGSDDG